MENSIKDLKEAAIDFLRLVTAGEIKEAYTQYIADDFLHHNGHFKGDRQSLMKAMEENHVQKPDKIITIKHALREGDLVAIHSHIRMDTNDELGAAVVHIFRFKGNRVVEEWELGEPVPADLVNENGMF
jgi:predicted SnoaL-like aldol condensation-catalyzing enzyme